MKAIIIPGNGNSKITDIWYTSVKNELKKLNLDVIAENMPDPELARKKYWIPFMKEKLSNDDSILIGHSSGAVAIMRYLEKNKCKLAILIGVCHTDLGLESEKKSGYYSGPWQWDKIKNNAEKIIIFASKNDPYIPISEPLLIKNKLAADFHEYDDGGHFGGDVNKKEFPEIARIVSNFIKKV